MAFSFFGGVHPKENKFYACDTPVQEFPEPDILIVPMSQHIGASCTPLVKKGDAVKSVRRLATMQVCAHPFTHRFPAS